MAKTKYEIVRGIDYRNTAGEWDRAEPGAVIDNLTATGAKSLLALQTVAIRKTTKAVPNG